MQTTTTTETTKAPRTFHVQIWETLTSYFGVRYNVRRIGFACFTADEATAEAEARIARMVPELQVVKGREEKVATSFFAEHYFGCTVCKITGVKPGCKRKACAACGGRGTIHIPMALPA